MSITYPPVAPPTTVEQVTAVVVELLADLLEEDPGELRERLEATGDLMPVDSLDMFDIVQDFKERTQISFPVRDLRRDTMRSVRKFAEFVVERGAA